MSEWQKVSTLVTFGSTWNIAGMGKTYVDSVSSFAQTVTLLKTSTAKFWFPGNGVDSYLVSSASITQGAISTALRVNGQTSFYVPKEGRWSDNVSLANFSLPGEVTFSFTIAHTSAKIPTAPIAPTTPVGVSAYEAEISIVSGEDVRLEVEEDRLVFNVQFENDFKDSVNGIEPTITIPNRVSIEKTFKMFGDGCLKITPEAIINEYGNIGVKGLTRAYNLIIAAGSTGLSHYIAYEKDYSLGGYWLVFGSAEMRGTPVRCLGSGNYILTDSQGNKVTVTVSYSDLWEYGGNCYAQWEENIIYYDIASVLSRLQGNFVVSFFLVTWGRLWHCAYIYVDQGDGSGRIYSVLSGNRRYLGKCEKSLFQKLNPQMGLTDNGTVYVDSLQIIGELVDFTIPPTEPITTFSRIGLAEVTAESTITVDTNPTPGDTLTLKGSAGGEDIVFTFVESYPLNDYEIQIGTDTSETASNIAAAINNIEGAEFVASAEGNVVTITAYTQTEFSMETDSEGLTLGAVTEIVPGFIDEEASVSTEFDATDGGKAVQEAATVSDAMDGLIDGLAESISASTEFDVPMDGITEEISVSTTFDGLIDYMGESDD